jgi:hypothetical protein
MYTVKFEIDAEIVEKINKLSTIPVEELASRYLERWLTDGRHTMFEARRITVAWPTDWWAAMIKHWGQRKISPYIRQLLHERLSTTDRPLSAPPDIREEEPNLVSKTVQPSGEGRDTIVTALILPREYYDRLLEDFGHGNVSRAVKLICYFELKCNGVKKLSKPYRMNKFIRDYPILDLL